jgi:uncharacterized protein
MPGARRSPPRPPTRTCAGCRRRAPRGALLRVVLTGGVAAHDVARRLPGRGAWLHPDPACARAAARGGLARSFRRAVDARALLADLAPAPPRTSGPATPPRETSPAPPADPLGSPEPAAAPTPATVEDPSRPADPRGGNPR